MGHGDTLVIGDAFYPSASSARHSMLVRADGVRATELLDAILHFFPSGRFCKSSSSDHGQTGMWQRHTHPHLEEYRQIVRRHDPRGDDCIGMIERFDFYKAAEHAYAVVATGETALYGCIILQKGWLS